MSKIVPSAAQVTSWHFRALWWMIVLTVLGMTLCIPILPIYDWLNPWDDAVAVLQTEQAGLRWMIGGGSSAEYLNGELTYSMKQRSFVVFPSVFTSLTVYVYSEGTGIEKGLKAYPFGALLYLLLCAGVIAFSWFVALPKLKRLAITARS